MSKSEQSFPWQGVLIGCGATILLGIAVMCGGVVWLASGPESGVRLSNEMDSYATEYLQKHNILKPSESLIAYYDATITMDGTEAAILTTERVIYHKGGQSTAVELSDITDIRHRQEGLTGDIIEIDSRSGVPMKIEIAPLNQGETFLNALRSALDKAKARPAN